MNTDDLKSRLRSHIAKLAPHQREREAGKLLVACELRIRCLEAALDECHKMQKVCIRNLSQNDLP